MGCTFIYSLMTSDAKVGKAEPQPAYRTLARLCFPVVKARFNISTASVLGCKKDHKLSALLGLATDPKEAARAGNCLLQHKALSLPRQAANVEDVYRELKLWFGRELFLNAASNFIISS